MIAFVSISIPVIYYALFKLVDQRLQQDIAEEIGELQEDLAVAQPQNAEEFRTFIRQYLQAERMEVDQFLVVIFDRQFFDARPADLPLSLKPGSPLMQKWQQVEQSLHGRHPISDPDVEGVVYVAEPLRLQGKQLGVFVVVHLVADEREEAIAAVEVVLKAMILFLLVASLVAWLASGKILKPLRSMATAARNISETDLSKRIQVEGNGELAEVAQTFNEMMDRLQSSFISQRNFIDDASHELRTPITIIRGHLELLGDDPREQEEVLAIVDDELDRMNRFVNDMLLLVKAGQPNFVQIEMVNLTELTEELYLKAKAIVKCDCRLDRKASGTIRIDRQRLTQAMMNLVVNANQHTPEDGLIALGSVKDNDTVRFWVRDTGTGIDAEDQQRIFERFARAKNSSCRTEGAGLGLAIVQAIVAAMNGKVSVVSAPGQGSTFALVFPRELAP
jgi:signal transduction histidine kinase